MHRLPDPGWNPPPDRAWRADTLHGLFAWCARRWPDRTAVRHGDREVGYGELSAAADTVAARLESAGVGPGGFVPVLMPRSPEFLAVLLAVTRLGAAYAALDPRWPHDRLAGIVRRLGPPLLVTGQDGDWPVPTWEPGADTARLAAQRLTPGTYPVGPDDPCAVFFTSGSSGVPNGVVCAHRGTVRIFDDWAFAPRDSAVVMPQSLAATWDAFGLDSWGVLLGGGTIILLDGGTLELTRRLRELIADDGANTAFLPTAVFHMQVETDLDAFTGLRTVGTGGERLSARHARMFLERHPGITLHNMYGPVESTIASTDHVVTLDDCRGGDVPIGAPLPGTEVHVLDGARTCAVGEVGEICLAGDGLALGYVDDPALTARRFVELDTPAGRRRLYRTRDLGFWSRDGAVCFVGRADGQLKIRGHRVEPHEIEVAAEDLPGIGRAVAVPVLDTEGACVDVSLFYVPLPGAEPSEQDVRDALARRLPGYLVPGRAHRLEDLPVLEDRKVDRRELAARAGRLRAEAGQGAPAAGSTERRVAAIFAGVLGVSELPRDVSFFALGGNSLSVTRASALLDEEFGVRVPLEAIFDHATVEGVAGLLAQAGAPT
ncbi:non-ribosomal peptide synthetase [Actinacidiphila reveromycinica]|uniref:non-ribosomal peptide synthetase n=1 Tax=Actinacidiphila reveromycinica TaxID=659352 RepID=UPI0019213BC7|nr:non-ribosomal peptide synthetase [Streptomyces sp. SN-593]